MKIALLFIVLLCTIASGQDKTTEKRTTKDSTGKTVTTESVIISKTEDITPRWGIITINPLKLILFYNLSFYAKINSITAIGIGIQSPTLSGINGFGFNIEARLYPSGKCLRGFYFAPNISVNFLSSNDSDNETIFSYGALLGWQWFPGDEFALGLGLGMDYYTGSISKMKGTAPAIRFDVGYAF